MYKDNTIYDQGTRPNESIDQSRPIVKGAQVTGKK